MEWHNFKASLHHNVSVYISHMNFFPLRADSYLYSPINGNAKNEHYKRRYC